MYNGWSLRCPMHQGIWYLVAALLLQAVLIGLHHFASTTSMRTMAYTPLQFDFLASDTTCDSITWAARLDDEPYASNNYTEFATTKHCSLALVAAGFPRAGSTLQMRMLENLGQIIANKSMISTYWNSHLHSNRCRPDTIEMEGNLIYCNELLTSALIAHL